ncbi:polysaccharide pyruvyl transferase family protein [Butyrivibrio sp. VCB2006]|uniref:polysaccharide pyruvyl transferase family protein n=1 Tax=Butyrivibrio sp. VCB2006 TaxID=1280679 RepID=UPI0004238D56|nr:polysaccharide pyruvyl transferase family protein [Butyrivibrio sp. VCB2006]
MREKKSALIITMWGITNYGNRLQNYAVSKIASDRGLEPFTLATKTEDDSGRVLLIKDFVRTIFFLCSGGKKRAIEVRKKKFRKFNHKYIPSIDNEKDIVALQSEYVFLGSDQIWNAYYVEPNDMVYGKNSNKDRLICISPSFGVDEFDDGTERVIAEYLEPIQHLCVREKSGAELIKRLIGRDVPVFLDPTLMLTDKEWEKIERRPINVPTQKYVLKYFLKEESETSIREASEIIKKYKLEEVKLLDITRPWEYIVDPSEFVYLIHHADVVLTDSFHACVFSILFNKPFWVYKRMDSDMSSRMDTLFQTLGMENRFIHNVDAPYDINYQGVEKRLDLERTRFNTFIDGIIREDV